MDEKHPLVRLEGVRKSYGEEVVTEVLHGIDLEIDRGEFVALVGPSGSGKSTLLNLLGLLDRPSTGEIRVDGAPTSTMTEEQQTAFRGRTLGFVFQFHHLLREFTALENVMLPMMANAGRIEPSMASRAGDLLVRVGLSDRIDYRASKLSGGQQQRVAIARALAMNPPLVLADEPTGNLDTETGDEVFQLLREFNRDQGTTFLIVTHDDHIAERCDRVVHLVDGKIV
jgi:lipoprotein-releasing system ATP-binding protein